MHWSRRYIDDPAKIAALIAATAGDAEVPEGGAGDLVRASIEAQPKLVAKFGAGTWLGTPRGAMQATATAVARLKASWLPGEVTDVCTGVGGDAIELARRGPLRIVDCDGEMVVAAMANSGISNACTGDAVGMALTGDSLHIDPDRRADDRRHSDADFYQPTWAETLAISKRFSAAVIKVAPAAEIDVDRSMQRSMHRAWISMRGSVREQSVLLGDAIATADVIPGQRSAWRVRSQGDVASYRPMTPLSHSPPRVPKPLGWIVDPDRSIRAAGLTETFASEFGLSTLGGPAGFLTADDVSDLVRQMSSMAAIAAVAWVGNMDDRKLRKTLRKHDWSVDVVKVRGGGFEPAAVRRRYHGIGSRPVTLWIGRVGPKVYAVISESR